MPKALEWPKLTAKQHTKLATIQSGTVVGYDKNSDVMEPIILLRGTRKQLDRDGKLV